MKSQLQVGAAALFAGIVGLLAMHQLRPTVSTLTHVAFAFDGGAPTGTDCLWATARADPAALALFGLDSDGGAQYVVARVCAQPSDSGTESLPSGMLPLEVTEREEAYDGGQPMFEAWLASDPAAPLKCACSTGASCSIPADDGGTQDAPLGVTLQPGWAGAGCHPKACSVFRTDDGGDPTWPSACPGGSP